MKIQTTKKSLDASPKTVVRVEFAKTHHTILRENRDGAQCLVVGAGKFEKISRRTLITLIRGIIKSAQEHKVERLAISTNFPFPIAKQLTPSELHSLVVENILLAHYEFDRYKTKKKNAYALRGVTLCDVTAMAAEDGVTRGEIVGSMVNACRDIANTPGGDMTPTLLGQMATQLTKGTSVKTTVLKKAQIEKLKMGALLGVAKGAKEQPTFIVLEYWGAGKPARKQGGAYKDKHNPVVFVGKGITFDTGGLNLKPGDSMLEMHLDMSGGAAVIAAVVAAAKLKIKRNIIGLIPAAENSVSGESFRPGDILTSMSGKTIDVLNTDAEGRLILADALTYAKRYNPSLVVDVATLTGAALVALGTHASALMTTDNEVADKLLALAEESGDYVWRLPLWEEYKQYTKGMHADIANIPWQGNARAGGAINGGMFLTHFADGYPWAHIDIAPRMTPALGDKLSRGATGESVRLLVKIAEKYEA